MLEYFNNNNKISYQSYGGGAKTLLLIHDIGGSAKDFDALVQDLQSSVRIIAVDLCGHGESYLPRKTVSVKTMAREVVALIKDCYIGRVCVVALGSGGTVALEAYSLAPELFLDFVFFDTFVSKKARAFFGEKVGVESVSAKFHMFRETFKRWVPAYREDFLIFVGEFDGKEIFRLSSSRMLFVYGDRSKGINIEKEDMDLPQYSNIQLYIVTGGDRWLLDKYYKRSIMLIQRFLIDGSNDVSTEDGGAGDEPDSPKIDINDLMYLDYF